MTGNGHEHRMIYNAPNEAIRFYVLNWDYSDFSLAGSGARVRLYSQIGSMLLDRTVPNSGSGMFWYVFDLNPATGQISIVNRVQNWRP